MKTPGTWRILSVRFCTTWPRRKLPTANDNSWHISSYHWTLFWMDLTQTSREKITWYNTIWKQKIQILIDQRQWRRNSEKPWRRNSTDFSQQLSNSGHTMVQKMALEGMERNEKKFKRKTVTMAQHKEESEMSQWTKYYALNTTLAFQWCRENSVSCMKFVRHRQWIVNFVLEVTETTDVI